MVRDFRNLRVVNKQHDSTISIGDVMLSVSGLDVCRKLVFDKSKQILERAGIKTDAVFLKDSRIRQLGFKQTPTGSLVQDTQKLPCRVTINSVLAKFDFTYAEMMSALSEPGLKYKYDQILSTMYEMARKAFTALRNHIHSEVPYVELLSTEICFGITLEGNVIITEIMDPMVSVWSVDSDDIHFFVNPSIGILRDLEICFGEDWHSMDAEEWLADVYLYISAYIHDFVSKFTNIEHDYLCRMMADTVLSGT